MLVYVAWMNLLFMLVDHGGCTIVYKSSCTEIYPIYLGDSRRTCGIKWKLNNSDEFVHFIYSLLALWL